ncbi:hypothetical protein [Streptomyces sp. TRM68367]|uniref:hypothetical protein n=1 Tax=Streptomyces sp. TRM68367 TaxID=2758415 RepID=UPI00165BADDF|nr:hypothetical protein [Streptomyces sp. TRM68367]MBC9727540.1 hypothetical protein [Streptomyces sp. TRM68367]
MGNRALRNTKIKFSTTGAALAAGGLIIAMVPSAEAAVKAAEPKKKTPEQIMRMCERSRFINGERQYLRNSFGTGFLADSCEFIQTKPMEFFNGPKEKTSIDYANCEPNSTEPTPVSLQGAIEVAQGRGKYTSTQQGFAAGIFGALNASWVHHQGTLDLTVKAAGTTLTDKDKVPVGKVLYMTFVPKMQRMTGIWRVKIDAREQSTVIPAQREEIYEAPEVVEGPVVLDGAAGAPGRPAGIRGSDTADC